MTNSLPSISGMGRPGSSLPFRAGKLYTPLKALMASFAVPGDRVGGERMCYVLMVSISKCVDRVC